MRRGLRDNGSEFTVDSIARYHLHDVLHHSHDVRGSAARATVAAYDGDATPYSDASWDLNDEVSAGWTGWPAPSEPAGRCSRSAAPEAGTLSRSRSGG